MLGDAHHCGQRQGQPVAQQGAQHARVADQQQTVARITGLPAGHTGHGAGLHGGKALSLRRSEIVHICPTCRILRRKLFPDFIEGMTIPFPHVDLRQSIHDLDRNTSVNHFLQDRG